MTPADNADDNTFMPSDDLDEALQREINDALGDMSLDQIVDGEDTPQAATAEGVRRGRVIAIQGDDVFVELGAKSQGILPAEQFDDVPLPNVGEMVEVTVEGFDERDDLLLLSRKGAVLAAAWETIEPGQTVEGRVTGHNKGGLELDVNGIAAFMPVSQIEMFRTEELHPYANQRLRCQVVDVDRGRKQIVVSRRALLEEEAAETRESLFESLQEGNVVTGTVKTIMPYGAFVDLGGIDGLLHISDMSYRRLDDPKEMVQEGQKVEVKVLKVDRDQRKISLGLKQAAPDPWEGVDTRWPVGEVVTGRITRLMDFGAFIELAEGVEGLIPISEMTFERRINHPREIVAEGDVVKVRVMKVDVGQRRISLSIKRVGDDPWMGASVRWPVDSVVEGTVKRIAEFGAFIELTPGVEGLVHVSELSDGHVRAVGDVVSEGQQVEAKVLSIDEERRRIALSIKQRASMPDYTGDLPTDSEPEPPQAPRKRKKPLKGGLDF